MAFFTPLTACVCLVTVTGLYATTKDTDTTDVTVTEDLFYSIKQRWEHFYRCIWETSYVYEECAAFVRLNYALSDILSDCSVRLCERDPRGEEFYMELWNVYRRQMNWLTPDIVRRNWPGILFCVILGIVGISGNITIIVIIARFMSKNKSATNVLIANIAVSDLLTCVICIPIQCYVSLYGTGFMGNHWMLNVICKGAYFMYYSSFYCSILTMLAIGFER
ncbi:hypothetical protein CAPTEDRAFT_188232 [Capitella teleta]|uniref:G-protein coupled receptors family 1 profile domain-containing protein n=1 Tax=Capitella teleta TaxID=283909 RepID=R7TEP4_CAPTE|nr:hypothetical protein CAPTEDRAFT_188232 [Capitella teleta]|eukprot:ELT92223.1 hypothetical protein CAPTEDRAFT_188232 [Capitella teleta]